jgi:glycoprotein endo-alpha-1,2-mannosidase
MWGRRLFVRLVASRRSSMGLIPAGGFRSFLLLLAVSAGGVLGAESRPAVEAVPRRVMAFYYPWYGVADGPGGSGRTVHWGRIDTTAKDIAASTHYPALGAYDSHDPKLVDRHCQWAREAGIDTFIVSWWGHGHYTDRAMGVILEACRRRSMRACIYYETVPAPRTPATAADDIVRVLEKYGRHPGYLRVGSKPVVFVYGRALQEMGLIEWRAAIEAINSRCDGGAVVVGDKFGYGAARVFDGLHTYNTAGMLRGMEPVAARKWAGGTYRSWVELADRAGRISTLTLIPGYDDTKIRKPGLAVERYEGQLYTAQWEEAVEADPHWILITSFNEWHEGSEVEPSLEYGQQYLDLTAEFARRFKGRARAVRAGDGNAAFSEQERARLQRKLRGLRIGVLPNPDSMAFWWLVDLGVSVEVLRWQDVAGGDLTPERWSLLLYCGGEDYRSTVEANGDVDRALAGYLKAGGAIAFLPALPWPFYYDENGEPVSRSGRLGLTLRGAWESPPAGAKLYLSQPKNQLAHVPVRFDFPESGDLRWRPFLAEERHKNHVCLLQLLGRNDEYLGDAVAYAELEDGGRLLYVWFGLLDGRHGDAVLYDTFDFLCSRLAR